MDKIKRHLQVRKFNGEPLASGDTVITPISQVYALNTRFFDITWNRPHAVQVQEGDRIQTIPIANVTRLATMAIFAFGFSISAMLWLFNRKSAR